MQILFNQLTRNNSLRKRCKHARKGTFYYSISLHMQCHKLEGDTFLGNVECWHQFHNSNRKDLLIKVNMRQHNTDS